LSNIAHRLISEIKSRDSTEVGEEYVLASLFVAVVGNLVFHKA